MVGLYVPELFQPHALQLSKNSPPLIERSASGDEHLGQLIEVVIFILVMKVHNGTRSAVGRLGTRSYLTWRYVSSAPTVNATLAALSRNSVADSGMGNLATTSMTRPRSSASG